MEEVIEVASPMADVLESDYIDVPDDVVVNRFAPEPGEETTVEAAASADDDEPKEKKKRDPQKRINELTRLRHEADERYAASETRNALLAEDNRVLTERANKAAPEQPDRSDISEKDLLAERHAALESGDLEQYSVLNDELMELKLAKRLQAPVKKEIQRVEPVADGGMSPAASDWLGANDWYGKSENAHLRAEVNRIEDELVASGMKYDKALYLAIDERVNELPDFNDVRGGGHGEPREEARNKPAPKSVVAPPSRGGEPPARAAPGKLSEHDKTVMKTYRLDPNDPKHRESYIKYRR